MPPLAPIAALSASTGIGHDQLQLLTALLAAYPLAYFYRLLFLSSGVDPHGNGNSTTRNLYVLITGLLSALWFMQDSPEDIRHSAICILATWLACRLTLLLNMPRWYAQAFSWVFNSGYLFAAYYYDNLKSSTYKVDWLTPQCVLCLRLISFATDFADGRKTKAAFKSAITEDQLPLPQLPSLLETAGFSYHFGGFLVGPQFPMERYRRWITGELFVLDKDTEITYRGSKISLKKGQGFVPSAASYAFQCVLLAAFYLGATQVLRGMFPTTYLVTEEYAQKEFWWKLGYMWLAGKFALQKYVGIWKLSEGPCVISGLVYNGYTEGASAWATWGALSNIRLPTYEIPWCLQDIVSTFNTNTNNWSKIYLFKRLRWMGVKELSALFTLLYLAAWHGWHPGYFICFGLEFIDMEAERHIRTSFGGIYGYLQGQISKGSSVAQYFYFPAYRFLCWLLTTSALFYSSSVAFDLLEWRHVKQGYGAVYWIGHFAVPASAILAIALRPLFKSKLKDQHAPRVGLAEVKEAHAHDAKANGNGKAEEVPPVQAPDTPSRTTRARAKVARDD